MKSIKHYILRLTHNHFRTKPPEALYRVLAENPNKKLSSSVYNSLYKRNLKMTYDKP